MLRYLRRLADADYALDRGMIPLGSCTMKLNATTEMEPISWPEFAGPAPVRAGRGRRRARARSSPTSSGSWPTITGYDAVSLQPNAGSQGEFAGLLAIRAYHRSRGRGASATSASSRRRAHGTNAACAVMAGLRVVVVATGENGDVDLADLDAKIEQHAGRLAAIMITYPSTHGVFEEAVADICAQVHDAGGQVYVDGANLNALVGLARPGPVRRRRQPPQPAQDLLHPARRGRPRRRPGRRPGAPRAVPAEPPDGRRRRGPRPASGRSPPRRSARRASCRSRGPTCGSWAPTGCRARPRWRSSPPTTSRPGCATHYPVLYTGRDGLVAHECILDLRPITKATGVTRRRRREAADRLRLPRADDVVPRGRHAHGRADRERGPRRARPVLRRHDRDQGARSTGSGRGSGREATTRSRNAPHTAATLVEEWTHPYSREEAVYPHGVDRRSKYWAPGAPDRRRLRRPQPRLLLPRPGGLRGLTLLRADQGS